MTRPLRFTPITGASPLLRAGPPASGATVLNVSQFLLPDALPLTIPRHIHRRATAVSPPAFPRSVQKPQTRLAPPSCRAPPGQSTGTRQAHPGTTGLPRFRCQILVSTRPQRLRSPFRSPPDAITCALSSSLTTTVFNQRSMRRFDASPRRATPKGHNPSSPTQHHDQRRLPTWHPPSRSWHTPVPQRGVIDPQLSGDSRDRPTGRANQLHSVAFQLIGQLPTRPFALSHTDILSLEASCHMGEVQ